MEDLFDRRSLLDAIILRLNIMQECLKWHSNRGEIDACKTAEDVVAQFLAALCDWKLVNLNTIKKNYPAADLGDHEQRLAIQVTVNGTPEKIRETHAKATNHHLGDDFDLLIILFLLSTAPDDPKATSAFIRCDSPKIEKWARPQLDALIDKCSTEKLRDVLAVLDNEMSAITTILAPTLVPRPSNLPYTSLGTLFKGRDAFLTALHERLIGHGNTLFKGHAIHGLGGVGKTRAALEYAWRYQSHYTARLFVSADSPETLDTMLAALCQTDILNLPAKALTDQNEQKAAVLMWLNAHSGWLLILDNADSEDALASVEELLPRLAGGHVLITSRLTDYAGGIDAVALDVLSDEDAAAFLLERTANHRTTAPDDDVRVLELARELGGLALALEQVAAHIRNERLSFATYLDLWHHNTAAALHWYNARTMHYPRSLAVTYQTSVDQLSGPAKEFFSVLSWFAPDPIPFSALESERAPTGARALLAELENLSLSRRDAAGNAFTLHRLVQEITRQQQPAPSPALLTAFTWINDIFPDQIADFQAWPIAVPLAAHANAISLHCITCEIGGPISRLLNKVAVLYHARAQYHAAEPLLLQALAIDEDNLDPYNPTIAISLNNLALVYLFTNRAIKAEELLRRALAIDEKAFGPMHSSVAIDLGNLAQLLKTTNRPAETESLMRRALAINETVFGSLHHAFASSLSNLAEFLLENNRHGEAETLLHQAIAIDEAVLGPKHPNLATDMNNLAQVFHATSRHFEAEPLMVRALAIDKAAFGSMHPIVARDLMNLARLFHDTNRDHEAEPLMRQALAIDEAIFGTEHPEFATDLNNLAHLLQNTNRTGEAEPLMRQALNIWECSLGKDHPKVATALNGLAGVLLATARHAEAEQVLRRALAIDEAALDHDHPDIARDMANLATSLKATNQLAEAEPLILRTVEVLASFSLTNGHKHQDMDVALNNYRKLLMKMGDTHEEAANKIEKFLSTLNTRDN